MFACARGRRAASAAVLLVASLIAPQVGLAARSTSGAYPVYRPARTIAPQRYTTTALYALDSAGTASVTETSTSFISYHGAGTQTRSWGLHGGSEVIGVFQADGTPYRLTNSTGLAGSYRSVQDTDGVHVTAWDSWITDRTYILKYRAHGTLARYFNAALFDWCVVPKYDASASTTVCVAPPRPLQSRVVKATQKGPKGAKLKTDAAGVVTYRHAKVPANTGACAKIIYPAREFVGAPLTIGRLGLSRSPAASKVTRRRHSGAVTLRLGVTLVDCVGDPLSATSVYLQHRASAKSTWQNLSKLRTSASGTAARTIRTKTAGTTWYRWYVPARAGAYYQATSATQTVLVK